jgi:predicted outer membrane repeat protein
MFSLLIAAMSFAAASDVSDNMTVSDAVDEDTIEITDIQEDALGEGQKSFEQLDSVIHNESVPEAGLIELNSSYTFSDTDNASVGTEGITIDKDITIDGKGYTLNASDKSSIFRITNTSHVILKNIIFTNGNATDGGAIYVESGSTIEVINCTFQNNFASHDGGAIYTADASLTSTSIINDSISHMTAPPAAADRFMWAVQSISQKVYSTMRAPTREGQSIF